MKRFSALFFVLVLLLMVIFAQKAHASVASCDVTVTPASVDNGTTNSTFFAIKNTGSTTVNWMSFTPPSSFTIAGAIDASGWSNNSATPLILTGGSLVAGDTKNVAMQVTAVSAGATSGNWSIRLSDDGGSSSTGCGGSLGQSIGAPAPTAVPGPSMSNLVVSNVTDSSVTVSWDTDQSTDSSVDYGLDASYGSNVADTTGATSHNLSISGLSANTVYHYQAVSSNANGSADSGDNSFTTAKSGYTGTTVTGTVTTTTVTRIVGPTPTPTPVPDRTPPYTTITTDFTKPFAAAPTIEGKATDPSGVAAPIEYSLDDGKNWAPVDTVKNPGGTSTTFSFTPVGLLDDNYVIRIRATDGKGNTGVAKASWTMVIDRLPPMVGGGIVTLGPLVVPTNDQGAIAIIAGMHPTITVSAVGGPTQISLLSNLNHLSDLRKNEDNGLWSTTFSLDNPGVYQLSTHAVDGAGNIRDRVLNTIIVQSGGVITAGGKPVEGATVAVYILDPATHRFVLWDGAAYGEENPQRTPKTGEYRLTMPQGTYYLRVTAGGYRRLVSDIFTVGDVTPITAAFSLLPARSFHLGPFTIPLPDFRQDSATVSFPHSQTTGATPVAHPAGGQLPYFSFFGAAGDVTSTALHGKPTVLTFLSSWSPQTSEQLAALDALASNKEINAVVVMSQESAASVAIFRKRGGYTIPIIADPDGILVEPLNIRSLPTHIFMDRKGTIQSVVTGVLSKEKLLGELIQ